MQNSTIVSEMNSWVGNSSYNFIGPLIFASVLLIGFLIGFWSGYKTSIYFLVGNVIGFVVGFFIIQMVSQELTSLIRFNGNIGGLSYNDIIDRSDYYIRSFLGIPLVFLTMFVVMIIQLIIYLFLRKRLFKNKIIENKQAGVSNLKYRLSGGTISLVSAFLYAAMFASLGAILGESSTNNYIYQDIVKNISGGYIKDSTSNVHTFAKTLYYGEILSNNTDEFASIFGSKTGNKNALIDLLKNNKTNEALTFLVADGFIKDNFDLIGKIIPEDQLTNIDLKATSGSIDWLNKPSADMSIKVTEDTIAKISGSIAKFLGPDRSTPDGVRHFLIASGLFI